MYCKSRRGSTVAVSVVTEGQQVSLPRMEGEPVRQPPHLQLISASVHQQEKKLSGTLNDRYDDIRLASDS